jgi:hypothetical protein
MSEALPANRQHTAVNIGFDAKQIDQREHDESKSGVVAVLVRLVLRKQSGVGIWECCAEILIEKYGNRDSGTTSDNLRQSRPYLFTDLRKASVALLGARPCCSSSVGVVWRSSQRCAIKRGIRILAGTIIGGERLVLAPDQAGGFGAAPCDCWSAMAVDHGRDLFHARRRRASIDESEDLDSESVHVRCPPARRFASASDILGDRPELTNGGNLACTAERGQQRC